MVNPKSYEDLSGQKFDQLTVIEEAAVSKKGGYWKCRCTCGEEAVVLRSNLLNGKRKSCGCLVGSYDRLKKLKYRSHGLRQHPLYYCWSDIVKRTQYPNRYDYRLYGARGIRMHEEWIESPQKFITYIETTIGPKVKGYQLDRKDNDGHYEPGNLRWVTATDNTRNRRCTVKFDWNGKTISLKEYLETSDCTIGYQTILNRVRNGWSMLDAVSTPLLRSRKSSKAQSGLRDLTDNGI